MGVSNLCEAGSLHTPLCTSNQGNTHAVGKRVAFNNMGVPKLVEQPGKEHVLPNPSTRTPAIPLDNPENLLP